MSESLDLSVHACQGSPVGDSETNSPPWWNPADGDIIVQKVRAGGSRHDRAGNLLRRDSQRLQVAVTVRESSEVDLANALCTLGVRNVEKDANVDPVVAVKPKLSERLDSSRKDSAQWFT